MQSPDGTALMGETGSTLRVAACTRWTELQGSLKYHIQLAGLLEATTIYRFLNPPGRTAGPQEFTVARRADIGPALHVMDRATPRGVTPLTQHLTEIQQHVRSMEAGLRAAGQEVVVVLATDGLPSNAHGETNQAILKEFLVALKEILSLPVWIVIRLCTDDEQVVRFYNSLDSEVRDNCEGNFLDRKLKRDFGFAV